MALDPLSFQTKGVDPAFGKSRNRGQFRDFKGYILGPIPPKHFIDQFLPYSPADKSHFRSSRFAFNGVPTCGRRSSDIYEPLVRDEVNL